MVAFFSAEKKGHKNRMLVLLDLHQAGNNLRNLFNRLTAKGFDCLHF